MSPDVYKTMHASPLRGYGIGLLLIPYLFVFEVLKTNKDPLGVIPPNPPLSAARICQPTNSQIDKWSILEAADGHTNCFLVIVPERTGMLVVQGALPGVEAVVDVHSGTPEISADSNIVESTRAIA